ncbi:MAG TPA: hypothetical protein VIX42_10515 [Edaphobacter sp.]
MKAIVTKIVLGTATLYGSAQTLGNISNTLARPDAHRLKTGQFVYRDSDHGKILGTSRITIQKDARTGNFNFSDESQGYFDQRWEAVASPQFSPISAKLSYGPASNSGPYFHLVYAPGKVSGSRCRTRTDCNPMTPVEAPISEGTVDQRIDWATVIASDLHPGRRFHFSVYDPNIGTSSVMAEVAPVEQIQVPAGSFNAFRITYRVEKATGAEQYVVFASERMPRILIREDFPDGTTSELLRTTK